VIFSFITPFVICPICGETHSLEEIAEHLETHAPDATRLLRFTGIKRKIIKIKGKFPDEFACHGTFYTYRGEAEIYPSEERRRVVLNLIPHDGGVIFEAEDPSGEEIFRLDVPTGAIRFPDIKLNKVYIKRKDDFASFLVIMEYREWRKLRLLLGF